eukprot:UC4_evm13s805
MAKNLGVDGPAQDSVNENEIEILQADDMLPYFHNLGIHKNDAIRKAATLLSPSISLTELEMQRAMTRANRVVQVARDQNKAFNDLYDIQQEISKRVADLREKRREPNKTITKKRQDALDRASKKIDQLQAVASKKARITMEKIESIKHDTFLKEEGSDYQRIFIDLPMSLIKVFEAPTIELRNALVAAALEEANDPNHVRIKFSESQDQDLRVYFLYEVLKSSKKSLTDVAGTSQENNIRSEIKFLLPLVQKLHSFKQNMKNFEMHVSIAKARLDELLVNKARCRTQIMKEVGRAYKKQSLRLHPDRLGREATEQDKHNLHEVQEAYRVLKDEKLLSEYLTMYDHNLFCEKDKERRRTADRASEDMDAKERLVSKRVDESSRKSNKKIRALTGGEPGRCRKPTVDVVPGPGDTVVLDITWELTNNFTRTAESYELEIRDNISGPWLNVYGGTKSKFETKPMAKSDYYVRVRALNKFGPGEYSVEHPVMLRSKELAKLREEEEIAMQRKIVQLRERARMEKIIKEAIEKIERNGNHDNAHNLQLAVRRAEKMRVMSTIIERAKKLLKDYDERQEFRGFISDWRATLRELCGIHTRNTQDGEDDDELFVKFIAEADANQLPATVLNMIGQKVLYIADLRPKDTKGIQHIVDLLQTSVSRKDLFSSKTIEKFQKLLNPAIAALDLANRQERNIRKKLERAERAEVARLKKEETEGKKAAVLSKIEKRTTQPMAVPVLATVSRKTWTAKYYEAETEQKSLRAFQGCNLSKEQFKDLAFLIVQHYLENPSHAKHAFQDIKRLESDALRFAQIAKLNSDGTLVAAIQQEKPKKKNKLKVKDSSHSSEISQNSCHEITTAVSEMSNTVFSAPISNKSSNVKTKPEFSDINNRPGSSISSSTGELSIKGSSNIPHVSAPNCSDQKLDLVMASQGEDNFDEPLANFLSVAGLSKYYPIFEKEDVDMEILFMMSDDDFKGLGLPAGE